MKDRSLAPAWTLSETRRSSPPEAFHSTDVFLNTENSAVFLSVLGSLTCNLNFRKSMKPLKCKIIVSMSICLFVGEKISIVLIRSPRVHNSKKGWELLFPLFYSLKANRIFLLPQYHKPSDFEDNAAVSLKLIFSRQVYLFSTFSCDTVCKLFPTFMHIYLMCQLVNQYHLCGRRVPEASCPLQRIVELAILDSSNADWVCVQFFILFHSGVSYWPHG